MKCLTAHWGAGFALLGAWAHAGEPSAPPDRFTWYGEIRERWESSRAPGFGLDDAGQDAWLLHRLRIGAQWQVDDSLRLVGELVSGSTSGWRGAASPLQANSVDVLQAYLESEWPLVQGRVQWRLGRQEISWGASRLVSVRESPNIRRAFDGLRMIWTGTGQLRIDAFVVQPVAPASGAFDDAGATGQRLWGIGLASAPGPLQPLQLETYYLGWKRDAARFNATTAAELRHSVGARLFGQAGASDWNMEAVWQWGSFGTERIRAWTLSADMGLTLQRAASTPRLGLKADVISGDRDARDRTLQTFNPLFPKLPYFSEANLATPANLIDLQPSIGFQPAPAFTASFSWNELWKFARADAFYGPPLTARPGTRGTAGRYLGRQYGVTLEWRATPATKAGAALVHFRPGALIREAGGSSGQFATAWVQHQF